MLCDRPHRLQAQLPVLSAKPMSWDNAILLAVAPFLPFDIIKAAAAALIGAKVRKALLLAGLLERTK